MTEKIIFLADWCGMCYTLRKTLATMKHGARVLNLEENQDLARKYNISWVPQMIIVKGEDVVNRYKSIEEIENAI